MKTRLYALTTLALCFAPAAPALSFDDDTHYVLTYLLARESGCTAEQARRVASACVAVDDSPETEPLHLNHNVLMGPEIRRQFHAFRDPYYTSPASADAAIQRHLANLLGAGLAQRNPGLYLHAFQDSFGHAGFWANAGHAADGHAPDFLSQYTPAANYQMALGTIQAVQKSLSAVQGAPSPPTVARVKQMLARITADNPVPVNSSPSWTRARSTANSLLSLYTGTTERIPTRYNYDYAVQFDSANFVTPPFAQPSQSIARFPLWTQGTLGLTMTPNAAGITYEACDYTLAVYDPWVNRGDTDGYRTIATGKISPASPTFDIPSLPVGKVRLTLTAVREDIRYYLKLDGVETIVTTKDGLTRAVDNLNFKTFAFDSKPKLTAGKYSVARIQVNCPITKPTLDGEFITDLKCPYSEGTLSLSFGPIPNPGRGARFTSIGWRGFDATDKVRFAYAPNKGSKTRSFSGIGNGRFTLARGVFSDATIAFSVSGTDSLKRPFAYSDKGLKLPRGSVGCKPNTTVFFYR